MTQYELPYASLLPSQLLLGSPFQPGSNGLAQFPTFMPASPLAGAGVGVAAGAASPGGFTPVMGHSQLAGFQYSPGADAATSGPNGSNAGASGTQTGVGASGHVQTVLAPYYYPPAPTMEFQSRTIYLGNIPPGTSAEEVLNHVRSGIVETLRLVPEKCCAFISFLSHASAAHFFADAQLKKLSIKGNELRIGWGRSSPLPAPLSLAVTHDSASRNVYLGDLPKDITEDEIRRDVERFGPIDCIKLIKEKRIAFVHFLSIGIALKCVTQLPNEKNWGPESGRKVNYGKDRCAYISKTQAQNAAQYLGLSVEQTTSAGENGSNAGTSSGSGSKAANTASTSAPSAEGGAADGDNLASALAFQSAAAVAIATLTGGGPTNIGNRTIFLGNIHPEASTEDICNTVRGGLVQKVRYIPDKHICFVTFVDATAAAQFYATAHYMGLAINSRRLKIGWGKHSGPLHHGIALAVTAGATRNVYIGNVNSSWKESKLRKDFRVFGEVEQINFLAEKNCAFVNFTDITCAIKAIEGIRERSDYCEFKINFGKDRCANQPRINPEVVTDLLRDYYERLQEVSVAAYQHQSQENAAASEYWNVVNSNHAYLAVGAATGVNTSETSINSSNTNIPALHGNNEEDTVVAAKAGKQQKHEELDQNHTNNEDEESSSVTLSNDESVMSDNGATAVDLTRVDDQESKEKAGVATQVYGLAIENGTY